MQVLGMCFVTSGTAKRETNQPRGLVGFSKALGDSPEYSPEQKSLYKKHLSHKRGIDNI